MAARQFLAVIERKTPGPRGDRTTLEVIGTGAKQHCEGALSAWRSFAHPDTEQGTPMLVVVEPEDTPDTAPERVELGGLSEFAGDLTTTVNRTTAKAPASH